MTNESTNPSPSTGDEIGVDVDVDVDDTNDAIDIDEMTEPASDDSASDDSASDDSDMDEAASVDTDDPTSSDATSSDTPSNGSSQPPPPNPPHQPPYQPPYQPPVRRLVRDPYTRLGGVASGISHYTGIDTSIIRILFLITTVTGGFGLLVYLLAWLVIPRADHWPPASPPISYRNMSGRDLGIGLGVVGLLVAVSFGASGATGAILVPLVLVAGGVWLLVQPPSTPAPAHPGGGGAATPYMTNYAPVGAPVPPPKRRGRWLVALAVIGSLFVLLLIPVLLVLALAFGDVEVRTTTVPLTVGEIPSSFDSDVDSIEIDLSKLDAQDFDAETLPVEIDADVSLGSIRVIMPQDLSFSLDSNVDLGSITVFGEEVDGVDIEFQTTDGAGDGSDVDLELLFDVDVGEIEIVRP